MGIINATPDSFYGSSRHKEANAALQTARKMIAEGAEIIDIGGYSSRPGANDISTTEEISRITPIIEAIRYSFPDQLVSIDTFRTEVAAAALKAGANIINDISGGFENESIYELAAAEKAPYIMMHMRGRPQNMQNNTDYDQLLGDIYQYFSTQLALARSAGLMDVILDMGIGFSKTVQQNYEVLKNLSTFQSLNCPILIGVSRKSLIYKTLNITPEQSLNGTTVLNTISLMNGADILRVHDVRAAKETIALFNKTYY